MLFMRTLLTRTMATVANTWVQRGPVITKDAKKTVSLGSILAMMHLKKIRDTQGRNDIALAAGLPDAAVPKEVKDELARMSTMERSPYLKYDQTSEYNADKLTHIIANFHNRKFNTLFTADQVGFSGGSTPVLHAAAGITQYSGSKALVIRPGYPLYDLPVEMWGGSVNKDARLVTALDKKANGSFFNTSGRWNLDYDSFATALRNVNPSLVYLNFPGNPTGYSPTISEYNEIVKVLIDHVRFCWNAGVRAPLVLEDIAYATMMHDKQQFYGLHHSISDFYINASSVERELLRELEQSLVVVHSFSKAFSIAGDRVGYFATLNANLREEISNKMTVIDLTPGRGALAAMTGALKAGDVNSQSMCEYQVRLRHFERGLNHIVDTWGKKQNIDDRILQKLLPVQARADAGFFSLTFFNLLIGQQVAQEFIDSISHQIANLPEASRVEFLNIFKNSRINDAVDAALWMMENARIITVPIIDPKNIMLRFSVGQTPIFIIDEALKRINDALNEIRLSEEMRSGAYPSEQKLTEIVSRKEHLMEEESPIIVSKLRP